MKRQDKFIMLPTNDFCFKELMQNPKIRKGFVACILGKAPEEIKETILLPTETRRDYEDDKLAILDVKVLLLDGTQMDLEMQVEYFTSWDKRTLFYLAKMYTGQLRRGEGYENLKKCIHVGILDFVHFPHNKECYHKINLCNSKTGEIYSDLLELHILELPKILNKDVSESDESIIRWMRFFNGKTQEDFKKMAREDEYMEEAVHTLFELSADEKKRMEYEAREKAIRDHNWLIQNAEQRGREEGHSSGMTDGLHLAIQIFKLSAAGKSALEIAEVSGVTLEQVEKILAYEV